ncbi:MAG: FecR family protein [Elusimicrobia bacterium]|nr:FecR family protein [Elusimicrobiota bacterium]
MKMKNFIPILPAALLAFQLSAAGAQDYDARLSSLTGTVDVLAAGETDSWREAEEEMPLSAKDKVRAGESSSAEITLDGGGVIRLGAGSVVEISSLDSASSSFFLRMGSLVAKIKKELLKRGARLQVRTPAAVAAIRGTEFGVEHDRENNETTAGVFDEGSLSVASLGKDGKTVAEEVVGKGSEVRLRAGARTFKPVAMRRLLRHRKALKAARVRLGLLRKSWKRLDPEKRRELRKRFLARKASRDKRVMKRRADGRLIDRAKRRLKNN